MSEGSHYTLKNFLLELGESIEDSKGRKYYDRVYSGDSEPLDIRHGRKHIEYQPDVVWKRRGRYFLIEIALTEDWRMIVGEIASTRLIGNSRLMIVSSGWDNEYLDSLISIVAGKLKVRCSYINFDEEEMKDVEHVKKDLSSFLEECGWI